MSSSWQGDEFFESVRGQIRANLATAADVLKADLKETIGIQGPPRSVSGEAPRMDSQDLYKSIRVAGPTDNGDSITAQAGTDLYYGAKLELEMNRPWLASTLYANEKKYVAIITGESV